MNGYDNFFIQMNDEEWERFAVDVLYSCGFSILTMPAFGADGGKDLLVEKDNITYIVSCKHYITSQKHVGTSHESDIVDRMVQHGANGFIGFYSTGISIKLQERLDGICKKFNYSYIIFDKNIISSVIQKMDSKILFNYGIDKTSYYMNVSQDEYKPLKCMYCEKDILTDENIPASLAGLAELKDGSIEFVYGCKTCWLKYKFYLGIFLEIEQALHVEQLLGWDNLIDDIINSNQVTLSQNFYENKNNFEKRVRQRQYPQNYGLWYGI